jgi:Cu(I)/Ag(I) efflux system membrane fusion protein
VAVPERSAARLTVGAAVSAQLAAYAGSTFEGQVADILPAADSVTRSVRVRVSFANPDGRLRPGLTATAHIAEAPGEEVVLVPSAAVIRGGDHDRVIKIEEGGRYAPVLVELGREVDGEIEVLKGLAAGERIAAAAQFLLDADASLKGFAPGAVPEQAP